MAKIPPGLTKENRLALQADLQEIRSQYANRLRQHFDEAEGKRKAILEEQELEEEQTINGYIEMDMREKEGTPEPGQEMLQQKPRRTGLSNAQLKTIAEEHSHFVTLKSGRVVFIPNK